MKVMIIILFFIQLKIIIIVIFRVSQGTTFLEVSKNQIKKIIIPIPNTLPEQQKIASMLENLDNLITSTQKLINQTQLLKKALMQKLLTKGIDHKKFKKVKMVCLGKR